MASTPTGGGNILGAQLLPATTAGSVLFAKISNVPVVLAFIALNAIVLFLNVSGIMRFGINHYRNRKD